MSMPPPDERSGQPRPAADVLTVRALTKTFPGVKALDGVDFTLRAGEVHALLGENGAGKSTLIKTVTGVLQRDGGTVELGTREIHPKSPADALSAGIGTVYQEVNLLPNLSVAENLFMGRQPGRFGLIRNRFFDTLIQPILDILMHGKQHKRKPQTR